MTIVDLIIFVWCVAQSRRQALADIAKPHTELPRDRIHFSKGTADKEDLGDEETSWNGVTVRTHIVWTPQ